MLVGLEFKPGDNRGHFNSLGEKFGLKNCQSQGGWRGADGFGKLWEGSINGFVDWTNALDRPVPWIKVRFLTGWWCHSRREFLKSRLGKNYEFSFGMC